MARTAAHQALFQGMRGHRVTRASPQESPFVAAPFLEAVRGSFWVGGFQPHDRLDPGAGWQGVKDNGGNSLKRGSSASSNLHSYWDDHMVTVARHGVGATPYVQAVVQQLSSSHPLPWTLPGNPVTWPPSWASGSAQLAASAYQPLVTTALHINSHHLTGQIALPASYDTSLRAAANDQLANAGFRLAATLNAIWP